MAAAANRAPAHSLTFDTPEGTVSLVGLPALQKLSVSYSVAPQVTYCRPVVTPKFAES